MESTQYQMHQIGSLEINPFCRMLDYNSWLVIIKSIYNNGRKPPVHSKGDSDFE